MTPPPVMLALIRRFEGCRLRAYRCPAGVWTLGWGSTGPGIGPGVTWTQAQADARMVVDAGGYAAAAKAMCPTLDGERLGAVADFAFNLGPTRLAGSTLRRKINAGDMPGARRELLRWVRGGGRVLPGLVLRRQAEAALLVDAA